MLKQKVLIHETYDATGDNYRLYASTNTTRDSVHLKFTSTWTGAKDPLAEQNKFETFLTKEDLEALISVLNGALIDLIDLEAH